MIQLIILIIITLAMLITILIIRGQDMPITLVLYVPLIINLLTISHIKYKEKVLIKPMKVSIYHTSDRSIVTLPDTTFITNDKKWNEASTCYIERVVNYNIFGRSLDTVYKFSLDKF